ncbi:MAG: hypothetical protein AB7L84_02540 [Acidimicrobiia bacterium]
MPGPAGELHGRPWSEGPGRRIWLLEPAAPALVLGSAQPDAAVDRAAAARAGVEVVRRRSGGAAVLLVPGQVLWVDAVVRRDDELWRADVGAAFRWFGRAWAAALSEVGVAATVHAGAMVRTRWSAAVCFAGLGPGEVTVAGAKLVGISQRRTRDAARFQAVVHHRWDPAPTLDLLALEPGERATARAELRSAAVGVADLGLSLGDLRAALLSHLP